MPRSAAGASCLYRLIVNQQPGSSSAILPSTPAMLRGSANAAKLPSLTSYPPAKQPRDENYDYRRTAFTDYCQGGFFLAT